MAHHTYRTEALVLRVLPKGDGDRFVQMYTKDFGYIGATATGLRKEQSKLRYSLQEYSRSHIKLVHGKSGWRLTGAEGIGNYFNDLNDNEFVARIFSVIRLFAGSEEENEFLYSVVTGAMDVIGSGGDKEIIEVLLMVRILYALGYIDGDKGIKYIENQSWDSDLLDDVKNNKKQLTRLINEGIEASQL